ncbi:MAG: hypothetical protein EXR07_18080 [Acetobacteraceae bacterium]|nr:hypothetical protein [Acetobacteraceae bacterium]
MTTQRTLAVLAAMLFVAAVALAMVGPRVVSLAGALAWLSPRAVENLHVWVVRVIGPWVWQHAAQPLLIRPAWLPVGALGLIFAGVALSLPARDATHRSHRRS